LLTPWARQAEHTFASNILEKTNHQVKQMTSLINRFLNVSRLEAGKIYLNKENFEINVLIEEIVEEVSTTSNHAIIILPGSKLSVNADREKIGQVINNILRNAVKYSPKDRNIEVSCIESTRSVQVSIRDEGEGIHPADQEKLFDRYFGLKERIHPLHQVLVSGFIFLPRLYNVTAAGYGWRVNWEKAAHSVLVCRFSRLCQVIRS
jgi:signal transduction histidine kinase